MGLDNEDVFFPNRFAEDAGSDDVLLGSEEVLLGSSLLDIFGKYKFSLAFKSDCNWMLYLIFLFLRSIGAPFYPT